MLIYFIINGDTISMIKVEFTESSIKELEWERYNHPNPNVQKKMEVLYLKSQGLPHNMIAKLCNISSVTLTEYLKQYRVGGINRLKLRVHKGNVSKLNDHTESLEKYFIENPPASVNEARQYIMDKTGIKRGLTQVREFLKKNGFKYRKTAVIPGKAIDDEFIAKQNNFKKNELEPILEEAKKGNQDVFLWMPPTLSKDHS